MKRQPDERRIEERILSDERVFTGSLIRVNRMEVVLPDGRRATRETVRHPGAAAIVPVDDEGNVTLVRQYRATVARTLLEIPAGKLNDPSEDPLRAAQRELKEETGLTAENWTHLIDLTTAPGFSDQIVSIYLATGLTCGEDAPDEDEFLSVVRYPLEELADWIGRGEMTDAKTLTGLMLAQRFINS